MEMIPTVGRMVYYKAYGTPGSEFPAGVNRAAVVTDVRTTVEGRIAPAEVRLCVMNPTGLFFTDWLKQGQLPGRWDWMPFQKDQQARMGYDDTAKRSSGVGGLTSARPEGFENKTL